MDHQLLRAKLNRWGYKLVYYPKLYKYDITRNDPQKADKLRKKLAKYIALDDALFCLPKDEVIINQKIDSPSNMILPTEVINHFIEKASYRAIMNYCSCRDSNHCKHYPIEYGCLFLGSAASRIHPSLHRSATIEEAKEHIRKGREAGMIQLAGRAQADTYYLGVGPHEKLFTVCSCCPCCCIGLAIPYVAPKLIDWFYKMPGVEVKVTDECTGCEKCVKSCMYGAIKMENEKAVITEHCRGCGTCVETCKSKAIKIHMDKDSVKKTIEFLEKRVDVS